MSERTDPGPAVVSRAQRGTRNQAILAVLVVGVVAWAGLALFADDVGEGAAVVAATGESPTDSFSGDLKLTYDHNSEVVVTASVANHGWFPVTVDGAWMFPATPLDSHDIPYLLLKQERVLVEGSSTSLPADRDITEPVELDGRSVTVPGGEELDVRLVHGSEIANTTSRERAMPSKFYGSTIATWAFSQTVHIPVRHVVVEAPTMCPAD